MGFRLQKLCYKYHEIVSNVLLKYIPHNILFKQLFTFTDIEETVSQITNQRLQNLDLSDNKILSVDSLASSHLEAHFEKLEKLDISANALREIPESVFKVTHS